MKNWGKCLHESQTNIWDVCVCVRMHVDDGRRGAKGSKVLPCLTQVQWSLPIPKSSMPLDTKKKKKKTTKVYQYWWNHEESILSNKTTFIISLAPKDITAQCHNLAAQ